MNRERFNTVLAALSLSPSSRAFAGGATAPEPAILRLHPNGWAPNNQRLPVLLYRTVLDLDGPDPAAAAERRFESNGWLPQWRDGIYRYHHYHSTAHEALGIAGGEAQTLLGGENGTLVSVAAGDCLILPVGTVHCCLKASADFLVVGAYPAGQHWDICREAPTEEVSGRMKDLAVPTSDPVTGRSGALHRLWFTKKSSRR